MKTARKYVDVWLKLAQLSFLMQLANRWSSIGWLGGKVVRLGFFMLFLGAIFQKVPSVAGYSIKEVALFFVTFNIVDIVAQFFLRGIYMVGRDVREGDMDFYLIQPVNELFRISSNLVDFLDFLTLIPIVVLAWWILPDLLAPYSMSERIFRLGVYALLCANGVVIAFAVHVIIASLTVRTQQMENTIWLYRDLVSLGRFPIDIYNRSIRMILTFGLPLAVMISFPTKALLGILSWESFAFALALAAASFFLALKVWRNSLKHYCSVSS